MNIIESIIINNFTKVLPHKLISKILRIFGIDIGKAAIRRNCYFDSKRVKIGDNTFVNQFCQFHTGGQKDGAINIGDNCDIGMGVKFICPTHDIGSKNKRAGVSVVKPINIKNGTWIGANATILSGVTIHEGCIIAAGSVVIKDCEPNHLYAGVPAKLIKKLD